MPRNYGHHLDRTPTPDAPMWPVLVTIAVIIGSVVWLLIYL